MAGDGGPRQPLLYRAGEEGRSATWNPALTRAAHVLLQVRCEDGNLEVRRSVNSGRARVRNGERIEAILVEQE